MTQHDTEADTVIQCLTLSKPQVMDVLELLAVLFCQRLLPSVVVQAAKVLLLRLYFLLPGLLLLRDARKYWEKVTDMLAV